MRKIFGLLAVVLILSFGKSAFAADKTTGVGGSPAIDNTYLQPFSDKNTGVGG